MGLFRKFRDKRAKTKASAKEQISFAFFDSQSESDEISYTPGLIDALQNDHAILGQQFQNLSDLFQSKQYAQLQTELKAFRTNLQLHTMTENIKLYTYLEQTLEGDTNNSELMRTYRREMNVIASGVRRFTKQYESCDFNSVDADRFLADYQEVGAILEQRLGKEESDLYPLYLLQH